MLNAVLGWLKPRVCRHRFAIEDLKKTGIPELEKPAVNEYQAWVKYYAERDEHDSHTKRVAWPCAECGKVFYAHCGLDIAPEHGPMFRRDPVPNVLAQPTAEAGEARCSRSAGAQGWAVDYS